MKRINRVRSGSATKLTNLFKLQLTKSFVSNVHFRNSKKVLFHFVLWKLCAFGLCAGLPQDNLNLQTIFWLWKSLRGIIRDHEKQQDKKSWKSLP